MFQRSVKISGALAWVAARRRSAGAEIEDWSSGREVYAASVWGGRRGRLKERKVESAGVSCANIKERR